MNIMEYRDIVLVRWWQLSKWNRRLANRQDQVAWIQESKAQRVSNNFQLWQICMAVVAMAPL